MPLNDTEMPLNNCVTLTKPWRWNFFIYTWMKSDSILPNSGTWWFYYKTLLKRIMLYLRSQKVLETLLCHSFCKYTCSFLLFFCSELKREAWESEVSSRGKGLCLGTKPANNPWSQVMFCGLLGYHASFFIRSYTLSFSLLNRRTLMSLPKLWNINHRIN